MYKLAPGIDLVLASGSPRRRELLSSIGLMFETLPSECEENILPGEKPREIVERLAVAKASEVAGKRPGAWIIGADTIVVIDERILGKPRDKIEARQMLASIQGRSHEVWGGFSLLNREKRVSHVESHCSRVEIAAISPHLIAEYVETGEPLDKAGAYAIQGIGASLVAQVEGSYSNVVGLNLWALIEALKKLHLLRVA